MTCTWRTALGGAVSCQRADRKGYIVAISQGLVIVQSETMKVRFWRSQPVHSVGYGEVRDRRVTITETHDNVTCAWTSIDGGGAFCNKASRHGYVGGITQKRAVVSNEASRIIYLGNQP